MKELIDQAPGVYRDIPDETYHRWKGASNSLLNALDESPAHALFKMHAHKKVTSSMKVGRAVHCLVLTPERFNESFVLVDRKTSPDDEVSLGSNDCEIALSMADSLKAHPIVAQLLGDCEARELSIVWKDLALGVLCKARLDQLCAARPIILDIKTSAGKREFIQSASAEQFERTLTDYHYYRQAAHYLDAAHAHSLHAQRFVNVVVEKEAKILVHGAPAHAIGVFEMDPEDIDAGAREIHGLLETWRDCVESGEWPQPGGQIYVVGRTAWAKKKDQYNDGE